MLFAPKEKGQGLVEYALILVLVAVVVIAVMRVLGPTIGKRIQRYHQFSQRSLIYPPSLPNCLLFAWL